MKRTYTQPLPPLPKIIPQDCYPENVILDLMNLLDVPAILVSAQTGVIHYANRAMVEITAFTHDDILKKSIHEIVETDGLENIYLGVDLKVNLLRYKRTSKHYNARAALVNAAKQSYVIAFSPVVDVVRDIQKMNPSIYDALTWLTKALSSSDLDDALRLVVESIKTVFKTDTMCIYRAENDFPRLIKITQGAGGAIFPSTLPSTDLIKLSVTNIWTPGKRVTTELHRLGRISDWEYLATTPLGDRNAGIGLLVIGDAWNPPSENLSALLELISSLVETIFTRHILVDGLKDQIRNHEHSLAVHRDALAGVKDGIIVITPKLTVTDINPSAEWLLGYTLDEVRGKTVDNILIGPERIMPALEAACHGEPTHNLGDCSLHRRDGQSFPALIRMMPVEDDGELIAVLIYISDLSEQIESQRNSQQLEHRAILGDFTAIFAHDLRNPVNNISTGMQLILSRMGEDDPNYDVVNRALMDCNRIDHLMESVLTFSRSMEPKLEPVNVNIFMRRLLDRWRPAMMRSSVQSIIQVPEAAPIASGDPRLLDRLFTNLINNAIDAMKVTNGGTIAVKVEPVKQKNHNQVKITISDTGPGIPDEVRPRIFEPFVTTKPTGTGLGLSICKRIVTVHKGSITVESFPGGTVFHVILPIYEGV